MSVVKDSTQNSIKNMGSFSNPKSGKAPVTRHVSSNKQHKKKRLSTIIKSSDTAASY